MTSTALITGASRGLGRALAAALVERGWRVVVDGRDAERLADAGPELRVYAGDPGDMNPAMHQAAYPGEDISDRPAPETVVPALLRLVEDDLPSGRYRAADLASVGAAR